MQYLLDKVKDGDTLIVRTEALIETIRLYGIDCPELGQKPYGHLARKRLAQLLEPYNEIEAVEINRDPYNRIVAEVWAGKICINTQLLYEGYAVAYRRHLIGEYQQRYLKAEAIARRHRLQFWSQSQIEMPWAYRKRTNIFYQATQ
jgi:micrococcal nuclease